MNNNDIYLETKEFWNRRFSRYELPDSQTPLPPTLDEGIQWSVQGAESLIDFGCGAGRYIFRAIYHGIKKARGIDISEKAIEIAIEFAVKNKLERRVYFSAGGAETLKTLKENTFDSAIASNILDNITPDDSSAALKEISRIVRPRGRIFAKFNMYIGDKNLIETWQMEEISKDFYREKEGIFLYNLNDRDLEKLLLQNFEIMDKRIYTFPGNGGCNRIYHLVNNKSD